MMNTLGLKDASLPTREDRSLITAILLSLYILILFRTAWLSDGAYALFRTVYNFYANQGLVFNPGERVQAFGAPLWILLLSSAYNYYHDFYFLGIGLTMALSIAAVWLLVSRLAFSPASASLGFLALLFSRAFIDYSTSGLGNPLAHLLVVIFILLYISNRPSLRLILVLSLVATLGVLSQVASLFIFVPPLLHVFWKVRIRKALLAVLAGCLPAIVWLAFSMFYYGFPFSNATYAILNSGIPLSDVVQHGLSYLLSSINSDPITLLTIIAGLLLAVLDRNLKHLAVGAGVLLYLGFVVCSGGDRAAGVLLTVPMLASVCILVCRPITNLAGYLASVVAIGLIGLAAPYPTLTSGAQYGLNRLDTMDRWEVFDERAIEYQGAGLLLENRYVSLPDNASVQQGIALRRSGSQVFIGGDGYLSYYAGRGVHILDDSGSSDALLARLRPLPNPYWAALPSARWVPQGYVETIASGTNQIADRDLASYYDKLSLVTRGSLADPKRLIEIWKLNTGAYEPLLSAYQDSLYLHLTLAEIGNPSSPVVHRDASGDVIFPKEGLKIALGRVSHTGHLQIELIDRVPYLILFSKNGRILDRELAEGSYTRAFRTFEISLPSAAVMSGYDTITIEPGNPSGDFLLGGIRLLP
jgi:arabinofuranosyltransferase